MIAEVNAKELLHFCFVYFDQEQLLSENDRVLILYPQIFLCDLSDMLGKLSTVRFKNLTWTEMINNTRHNL